MFPKWYEIALAEHGQKEIAGNKDNPRIQEYLQTVFNYKQHDEVPWCSAFTGWCLMQAGYPITHSALARSWLAYGKQIAKPQTGAIVVLKRGTELWQGHVGFYDSLFNGMYRILGGNQGNSVSYQLFDKSKVLSIRWPHELG